MELKRTHLRIFWLVETLSQDQENVRDCCSWKVNSDLETFSGSFLFQPAPTTRLVSAGREISSRFRSHPRPSRNWKQPATRHDTDATPARVLFRPVRVPGSSSIRNWKPKKIGASKGLRYHRDVPFNEKDLKVARPKCNMAFYVVMKWPLSGYFWDTL